MPSIAEIKDALKESSSDQDKITLRSQIETLQNDAEHQIRQHQRIVGYDTREFTLEHIVKSYSEGLEDDTNELFVPDYQREFVWLQDAQSRLIESLLVGLPIPYIFVADVDIDGEPDLDGKMEIVDGSQRIRTLHAFMTDQLTLEGLTLIPQLNGFKYSDFPASRQRRFRRISIRTIELSDCTEETRRDLFERINTGSDELKPMEIRKGAKHGDSALYEKVIAECAKNARFKSVVPISPTRLKRQEDHELVLRFFAYLDNYKNFEHSVKDFLDDYLAEHASLPDEDVKEMLEIFSKTMDFADKHFPFGFRKSQNAKSTPRVRFESLAIGIALALKENPNLEPQNINDWLFSDEFKKHTTSDASNSKTKVTARIEYVRDQLLNGSNN